MHSNKDNLQVLYEDNHLIIINKRAGDLIQGDKTLDTPLSEIVKEYIKETYHKPGNVFLGVPHRLDRPTTGIVIFTRTSKALERLNAMLREKRIQKTYWAIVKQTPKHEKDTLVHFLRKNARNNKSSVFRNEIAGSKKGILHYRLLKKLDRYFLLEIDLETGRHHQIRAQLSFIGCPIKGDLKYGFPRSNSDGSIHLHAREISFIHPVNEEKIHLKASLPKDPVWQACV